MVKVHESSVQSKPTVKKRQFKRKENVRKEHRPRGSDYERNTTRNRMEPSDLPFGRRLARRSRGNQEKENTHIRDFKMTKEEAAAAKRRRCAVRAEYAKKSRIRGKVESDVSALPKIEKKTKEQASA